MTAGDNRQRPISDEDAALWQAVIRTIKPLKRPRPPAEAPVAARRRKLDILPPKAAPVRQPTSPPSAPHPRPAPPPAAPPLAALARRERQRLARGTAAIEARLDLHGRSQQQAHGALLQFLRDAQARDARLVLVITGKGASDDHGGRGVLRRQVPLWLALPEFRAMVIGFSAAGIGHGGEGALYVRLRRGR